MRLLPYQFASNPANERPSWGNRLTFWGAAALLLTGVGVMLRAGPLSGAESGMDLLAGVGLAGAGFVLSWSRSRNRAIGLLLVGMAARMILLPLEPGVEYRVRMAAGEQAAAGTYSPHEPTRKGMVLAEEAPSGIERMNMTRAMMPSMLLAFQVLSELGESEWGGKAALVALDMLLGLLFVWRLGAEKACLYLWNPLVIYCVAGMGHPAPVYLLPIACAFLMWKGAVDDRGGSPFVSSSGDYGGVLEKQVWMVAALIGLGCSFNVFFAPLLVWLVVRVTSQAGLLAAISALVFGVMPVSVTLLWGWLRWAQPPMSGLLDPLRLGEGPGSFFPGLVGRVVTGSVATDTVCLIAMGIVAGYLILRQTKMERFGGMYFGVAMLLSPHALPWHFIWMAPFAMGTRHAGFKLASIFGLVGLLASWPGSAGAGWIWALYWIPFVLGMAWYRARYSAGDDSVYVRRL